MNKSQFLTYVRREILDARVNLLAYGRSQGASEDFLRVLVRALGEISYDEAVAAIDRDKQVRLKGRFPDVGPTSWPAPRDPLD